MSSQWIRAIGTLLVIALAGCASTRGFSRRPESTSEKLNHLKRMFCLPETNVLKEFEDKSDEEKRGYRNKVVHGRLLAIDIQFGLFKEAIYKQGIRSNLVIDMLGVAVGTAGALTVTPVPSRILSALSGGISGTGTAINKNLYYERTLPALLALMDANREEVLVDILSGLKNSIGEYPLERALADLERYLQAGSIPSAIAEVTGTAGKKKAKAQRKMNQFRVQ